MHRAGRLTLRRCTFRSLCRNGFAGRPMWNEYPYTRVLPDWGQCGQGHTLTPRSFFRSEYGATERAVEGRAGGGLRVEGALFFVRAGPEGGKTDVARASDPGASLSLPVLPVLAFGRWRGLVGQSILIGMLAVLAGEGIGCFHRPGKLIGRIRTCKWCGVAIEECPCVNWGRTPQLECPCCISSGWVAIVRGRIAKFLECSR